MNITATLKRIIHPLLLVQNKYNGVRQQHGQSEAGRNPTRKSTIYSWLPQTTFGLKFVSLYLYHGLARGRSQKLTNNPAPMTSSLNLLHTFANRCWRRGEKKKNQKTFTLKVHQNKPNLAPNFL